MADLDKTNHNPVVEVEEKSAELIEQDEKRELRERARLIQMHSLYFYGDETPKTVPEILADYDGNWQAAMVELQEMHDINKGRMNAAAKVLNDPNIAIQINMNNKNDVLPTINDPGGDIVDNEPIQSPEQIEKSLTPCPYCEKRFPAEVLSQHSINCDKKK